MPPKFESYGLKGLRLLIAEDEFLLAIMLEQDLQSCGCSTLGPFGGLAQATQAARDEPFDCAILDVNLNGEAVFPLADELVARAVPFVFLSGYSKAHLPERFRTRPRVSKPYDLETLVKEIARSRIAS